MINAVFSVQITISPRPCVQGWQDFEIALILSEFLAPSFECKQTFVRLVNDSVLQISRSVTNEEKGVGMLYTPTTIRDIVEQSTD